MGKGENHIETDLLHKYITGETNPVETRQVEVWLSLSQENQSEYEATKGIWSSSRLVEMPPLSVNTNAAWKKVQSHIRKSSVTKNQEIAREIRPAEKELQTGTSWKMYYRMAAVLVIGLGLFWLFYIFLLPKQNIQVAYTENDTKEVSLPDGTKITLNRNSKVSWNDDYGNVNRTVELNGEAFFEVTSDKTKPFIVKTSNLNVQVLGTRFVVNTLSQETIAEVVVESGSVMVYNSAEDLIKPDKKLILQDGEKAILKNEGSEPEKDENTDLNAFAFKSRQLLFEGLPLEQVVIQLENYYGIPIQIVGNELKSQKLSARFNNKPLENVLEVLELTFDIEARKENDKVILQEKIQ